MNGYELAAKLRAGGFCPASLKLVAITGYAKDPEALASQTAAGDGHLVLHTQIHGTRNRVLVWESARRLPMNLSYGL
jgi:hypothetical protein